MEQLRKRIFDIIMILFGNTTYALGIVMFVLPANLITGGTTGLALSMEHFFGVPISIFVFCFNLAMFILGALVLGKAFALTTLISTFYYPVILGILQNIPTLSNFTDDPMLATVCGGLMIGFSIGLVIRAGASTGGMDVDCSVHKRDILYCFRLIRSNDPVFCQHPAGKRDAVYICSVCKMTDFAP